MAKAAGRAEQPKKPYRINPRVARERAALGGKASHTVDAYITRVVNRSGELTDAQRARLAALVDGGDAR
jgi:hypothetical protein